MIRVRAKLWLAILDGLRRHDALSHFMFDLRITILLVHIIHFGAFFVIIIQLMEFIIIRFRPLLNLLFSCRSILLNEQLAQIADLVPLNLRCFLRRLVLQQLLILISSISLLFRGYL